jgi:colanic acid biosynthesis glycosyl transferase WcaI
MRIALWGINYYPEKIGIGPHTTALSQFLATRGHEVRIHTSFPYYPAWTKTASNRFFFREEYKGVCIIRTWHYVPRRPAPLNRIWHELSFSCFSFLPLLFGQAPDLLVVISPPLSLGVLAAFWRCIRRRFLVVQIQDLQPDAAISLGMLQNPGLKALARWAECCTYRGADRVLAISRGMLEAIAKKDVAADKLLFFPNGFDEVKRLCRGHFRLRHGIPDDCFLVVYSGNLGAKQGLEKVLSAAEYLPAQSVRVIICGDGPMRREVLQAAENNAVIQALSLLEETSYWEMIADCDLYLVPQRTNAGAAFFPSKLLPALAYGRPVLVLADRECELAHFVERHRIGQVADEEDGVALATQILALRTASSQREDFARQAARFGSQFSREKIFPEFEQELLRLLQI